MCEPVRTTTVDNLIGLNPTLVANFVRAKKQFCILVYFIRCQFYILNYGYLCIPFNLIFLHAVNDMENSLCYCLAFTLIQDSQLSNSHYLGN